MSAVPKLRFPKFDGEWQSKKLGEIASFRRGSFPQPYGLPEWYDEENGMPFVQVFDVDDNYQLKPYTKQKISKIAEGKSVFVPKGSIIITIQGSIGRIALTQYDSFVDRTLLIFTGFNEPISNGFFLNVIHLLFEEQKKRAPGGTIKTITKEVLSKFDFYIPSLPEQQKIASFLSSVDKKIDLLRQKKDALELYKKGLMQKIFSQEIRFKADNGSDFPDWEEVALGEYVSPKNKRNRNLNVSQVYSVTNSNGFVKQAEYFDGYRVASADVSSYKVVEKGDFAYNPSRINVGSIGFYNEEEPCIVSPLYIIFELQEGVSPDYLNALLETHSMKHAIEIGCAGSVRDSLSFDVLSNIIVPICSIAEQKRINSFLSAVDTKIQKTTSQIEQMETFKKGLLQQMFV